MKLTPEKRDEYNAKYDIQTEGGSIFKQLDREESLIHLMRVNLLKRMESSIFSFAITVRKLLEMVNSILAKIERFEEEPGGGNNGILEGLVNALLLPGEDEGKEGALCSL